jgi:ABC-2 type transport system permease protein
MKNMWFIAKRELQSYFVSPIAYIVGAIFLLFSGLFFYLGVLQFEYYSNYSQQMMSYGYGQMPNVNQVVFTFYFFWLQLILILIIPLLTMRLFAEEKRTGTEELLLTSPLSVGQIVGGKFLASLLLFLVLLVLSGLSVLFSFLYGNPELLPILSGYLGLLLVGAAFISIGLLFSALTENQIISAVLTFGTLLILQFVYYVFLFTSGFLKNLFGSLSFTSRFVNLVQGNLDTADLVYFLSFTFIALFLTHSAIQSRRWR